jgi:hypothetical protein
MKLVANLFRCLASRNKEAEDADGECSSDGEPGSGDDETSSVVQGNDDARQQPRTELKILNPLRVEKQQNKESRLRLGGERGMREFENASSSSRTGITDEAIRKRKLSVDANVQNNKRAKQDHHQGN